jgi:uncharacterized membrane protein YccC
MNTQLKRYLLPLSGCAVACLLVACATDRTQVLRESASRLDDASSRFSSQIQYQGDDDRRGRVSGDAVTLAQAAHDLEHALDRRDSRDNVDADYQRVTQGYQQLHAQLADEGYAEQNRQVLADFDRVTAAYRDVEAGMSGR